MDVHKENLQGTSDDQKASESGKENEKEDTEQIFCQETFLNFGSGDRRDLCKSCSKWAQVRVESAEADAVIHPLSL